MSSEVEHVCLVPFPEVADVVAPWLEHSVGARPSHGIPPHVTLLLALRWEQIERFFFREG
ncbi:MAG: hypothetical protein ACJ75G_06045 [Gaiellaceae bacterium]